MFFLDLILKRSVILSAYSTVKCKLQQGIVIHNRIKRIDPKSFSKDCTPGEL